METGEEAEMFSAGRRLTHANEGGNWNQIRLGENEEEINRIPSIVYLWPEVEVT